MNIHSARPGKKLLLLIIPLYAIILSAIFLRKASPFYMSQPDPCYIYLFNGMNLAGGNMEIGNIDNPGITVHCFAAVVIFVKHLFSFSPLPIYQDVILNSESYLFACSVLLIFLFVGINYGLGSYVFRHTKSIGTAMVFQLVALINIGIVQRAVILCAESFIIIATSFFMAYLYCNCVGNRLLEKKQLTYRKVVVFAVFSGFLIATKYTCLPVIILVLFFLDKNKQRLLYVGMSILSFLFFIIPALLKFKNMYQWVWALFSHDGIYGAGKQQVINPSRFLQNLKDIFLTDTIFTSMYVIIFIAFAVALINHKKIQAMGLIFRPIMGVWLSITTLILMVAKHCDFHYLIFAECCFPLGLILSYRVFSIYGDLFSKYFQKHQRKMVWAVFTAAGIFLVIEKIRYIPFHFNQPVGISKYVDEYKTVPLIISVNGLLACERKEPALFLGYMYSGNLISLYYPFLEKTYPDTYLYMSDPKNFIHWEQSIPIAGFSNKNKEMLVYLKGYDDAKQQALLNRFCPGILSGNKQLLFRDSKTLQSIYLLNGTR